MIKTKKMKSVTRQYFKYTGTRDDDSSSKNLKKEKVPNHIYNISNGPAQYFLLCLIFPLTLVSSSKNDDLMKISDFFI